VLKYYLPVNCTIKLTLTEEFSLVSFQDFIGCLKKRFEPVQPEKNRHFQNFGRCCKNSKPSQSRSFEPNSRTDVGRTLSM